jgi:hypothetical protein
MILLHPIPSILTFWEWSIFQSSDEIFFNNNNNIIIIIVRAMNYLKKSFNSWLWTIDDFYWQMSKKIDIRLIHPSSLVLIVSLILQISVFPLALLACPVLLCCWNVCNFHVSNGNMLPNVAMFNFNVFCSCMINRVLHKFYARLVVTKQHSWSFLRYVHIS